MQKKNFYEMDSSDSELIVKCQLNKCICDHIFYNEGSLLMHFLETNGRLLLYIIIISIMVITITLVN